jgi:hypothetical protein
MIFERMMYYVFANDLGMIRDALHDVSGINHVHIQNNQDGILPEKYIEIKTELYTDEGLHHILKSKLGTTLKYVVLKPLSRKEVLI